MSQNPERMRKTESENRGESPNDRRWFSRLKTGTGGQICILPKFSNYGIMLLYETAKKAAADLPPNGRRNLF